MSSRLSTDMMNKMDSILNKELELLGDFKRSTAWTDKENNVLLSSSADAYRSTSSVTHHSRKNSNCGERSPRVTFKDNQQGNGEVKTDQSFKMQKEIITLQSKVLELEMKIASMTDAGTQKKNTHSNSQVSLARTVDSSKITSVYASPTARTNEQEIKSSLRSTVDHARRTTSTLRVSPILHEDQEELSRYSPVEYSKTLAKSPSGISSRTTNKSSVRKSIKRNSSRYGLSISGGENSYSTNRTISSTSYTYNSAKSNRYQDGEDERLYLRKQIKILKEEYDNDRTALVKERVKGKDLSEELKKLSKKMNRLEVTLHTAANVQGSYMDLMESFGKSENIRKQQRHLIERLNKELRSLKGEDDLLKSDLLKSEIFTENKIRSKVKKQARSGSKKKTIKAF